MPNYYRTLGILPDADEAVIQAAYRALMRKYHPDVNTAADASHAAAEINAAFAVLGDPERREAYDAAERARAEKRAQADKSRGTRPPSARRSIVRVRPQARTASPLDIDDAGVQPSRKLRPIWVLLFTAIAILSIVPMILSNQTPAVETENTEIMDMNVVDGGVYRPDLEPSSEAALQPSPQSGMATGTVSELDAIGGVAQDPEAVRNGAQP